MRCAIQQQEGYRGIQRCKLYLAVSRGGAGVTEPWTKQSLTKVKRRRSSAAPQFCHLLSHTNHRPPHLQNCQEELTSQGVSHSPEAERCPFCLALFAPANRGMHLEDFLKVTHQQRTPQVLFSLLLSATPTATGRAPARNTNSQFLAREEALACARCCGTAPAPPASLVSREKEDATEATTRDDTFCFPEAVAL